MDVHIAEKDEERMGKVRRQAAALLKARFLLPPPPPRRAPRNVNEGAQLSDSRLYHTQ